MVAFRIMYMGEREAMKDKNNISINIGILIILIGLIFWIFYLFDSEMSRYGIYTMFSYRTHELLSGVPLLCLIITICWLIFILASIVRKTYYKSNVFLHILLLVLFFAQINYIHSQSQIINTSCITGIESMDKQNFTMVINSGDKSITLEYPMLLQDFLKTDGTEYGITYEWSRANPNSGKLTMVQPAD